MEKILISLTEEQMKWLEDRKEETGASIAEIIRRCINKYFTGQEKGVKSKKKEGRA